jgi:predicted MFS family arabinose efflux permease
MRVKEGALVSKPAPLWRNRDYMILWSGQTISSLGTGISQLAFPLLILALSHSPAQAGFASALFALPYLIFSLPVGALIDRWNRKRVMILCDVGRALNSASIPAMLAIGHLTVAQLYVNALVEGTLFVFFNIAEVACLPRVVTREQLPAATAQNMATSGVASLLGPPLGGVLYSVAQAFPFLADAISYAVSFCSLPLIRATFQEERTAAPRRLHVEIGEGLVWLWRQPLIRYMAFLTGGYNLVGAGEGLLLIVLAQRQHASPAFIGVMFAIGGIGGIVGSLVGPAIQKRFSFGQVIIALTWLTVLLWPLYAIAPNPLVLGAISAGLFLVGPIYNVVQFSYRLALIPDQLQGRVNSVFRLLAFGFQPLGAALIGVLIQRLGAVPTVLVFAVWYVLLAVMTTLNTHVRHARPLTEAQAA